MGAPRDVIDIITRLQRCAQEGSKSDRMLAAMVLSDPDFASKASISDIAARIGVSEPTVTRFCRSLGCEGVRDFKFWLAQAMAVGGRYLTEEPLARDAMDQRVVSIVGDAAIASIERVMGSVDVARVIAVAEHIAISQSILCFGSGGTSSMMATELQNRLFRLGLFAVAQVDGQLQRMNAATATAATTLIAFSTSGYAQSVVDATQVARQYGATTVAITAPGSALARVAETVIPFQPHEDGNLYKPTSSRFALLAIVDMLATAVAETRGTRVMETLRRIKQSLNTFKVEDPGLPLGD